jgi:hypothetical protein
MTTFAEPVVAWQGSPDSNPPLVVLLHGHNDRLHRSPREREAFIDLVSGVACGWRWSPKATTT